MQDQSHCTSTGFTTIENKEKPLLLKELKKLWEKLEPNLPWEKGEYSEANTLLLDDSPYKALLNPVHLLTHSSFVCHLGNMTFLLYPNPNPDIVLFFFFFSSLHLVFVLGEHGNISPYILL
jgi:hypothetical protein